MVVMNSGESEVMGAHASAPEGGRRRAKHAGQRRQKMMGDFFKKVDPPTRQAHVCREFRKARQRTINQHKRDEEAFQRAAWADTPNMHRNERTFSCVTQNANGIGGTDGLRDECFRAFKKDDAHGRHDIVFLQETHVDAEEIDHVRRQYAKQWGFRTGSSHAALSFWSAANNRKGGVSILLDPYGHLTAVRPCLEEAWSPYFMAVIGQYAASSFLFLCVYAPHQRGRREAYYRALEQLTLPEVDHVVVGGDFNCTLDASLDRSWYRRAAGHESPALEHLMATWGLVDAFTPPNDIDHVDLNEFYEQSHTYRYTVREGVKATARLDRWYTTAGLAAWVQAVEVQRLGNRADHSAVRMHLSSPSDPVRIRKPARVYPAPALAAAAVKEDMSTRLHNFLAHLNEGEGGAANLARDWDEFKVGLRKATLGIIKQRRKAQRATYKQKLRRLLKQEGRLRQAAAGQTPTVEVITDMFDAMTLTDGRGGTPLARVRSAITACTNDRAAAKQRRLFREGGHNPGKSTRQFYTRVSTKYADNSVHRLDAANGQAARGVHDKADTLADAWTPIFQQPASSADDRERVLRWLGDRDQYKSVHADLTSPITEAEVATAIGLMKPGKACGPDRLGNDWYRDFADQLIPILTQLYNLWYEHGTFPTSFLEADIFCLKKRGRPE
ncbi:hypothetical protein PR001_g17056 [Phytophthora rubi]|uniref:Endonuclease/exonuclease/phosphatase domain-containing protein n=1 Tax=Phytophthora rubi TaxID=129364 RepID=A0A6A3KNR2_9STRA|nr:hypothetical protein PR001_g17056 [Phytophthora rubi]